MLNLALELNGRINNQGIDNLLENDKLSKTIQYDVFLWFLKCKFVVSLIC